MRRRFTNRRSPFDASLPMTNVDGYSSGAEGQRRLIGDEGREVGQRQHVAEQEGRPSPAVCFAPDDTQRRGALRRKYIPREECEGGGEAPMRGQDAAQFPG